MDYRGTEVTLYGIALLIASLVPASVNATEEGRALLGRGETHGAVTGTFVETRRHPFLKDPLEARGRFAWRQGEFHWWTETPDRAYFRGGGDAQEFLLYYPEEKLVEAYPSELLRGWRGLLGAPLAWIARGRESALRVVGVRGSVVTLWLHRRPRGERARHFFLEVDRASGIVSRLFWDESRSGPVSIVFQELKIEDELPGWTRDVIPSGVRRVRMGRKRKG